MNTLFSALWNCCIRTVGRLPFPAAAHQVNRSPVPPTSAVQRIPTSFVLRGLGDVKCMMMLLLMSACIINVEAQTYPQLNWYKAKQFDLNEAAKELSLDKDGNIYSFMNSGQIRIFTPDLVPIASFYGGGGIKEVNDIYAVSTNLIYVAIGWSSGFRGIKAYNAAGVEVRSVSRPSGPRDIAVWPDGTLAAIDLESNVYQYVEFDSAGVVTQAWYRDPDAATSEFSGNGTVFALEGTNTVYVSSNSIVREFSRSGKFRRSFTVNKAHWDLSTCTQGYIVGSHDWDWNCTIFQFDGRLVSTHYQDYIRNAVIDRNNRLVLLSGLDKGTWGTITTARLIVYENGFRTMLGEPFNRISHPQVVHVSQRYGTSLLDIDYKVVDPDSPSVTTAALAFRDGAVSLEKVVRMNTFVEGTGANLGPSIATNTPCRLTWDAAADFTTNFVDLAVTILAKDERDLLGLHFLTIPSSGGDPELTINRSPVTQAELMPMWYWLLATQAPGLTFSNQSVYASSWLPPDWVPMSVQPGVNAVYFNNNDFSGASATLVQTQVNDEFAVDAAPTVQGDDISIRWSGFLTVPTTGAYTLGAWSSGTSKLWINGVLAANQTTQGQRQNVVTNLVGGVAVPFVFDTKHFSGGFWNHLMWSGPGISDQLIPSAYFTREAGDPIPKLASGTTTTAYGRRYLFEEILGVREATPAEILRAKEAGHPGTINRYTPRVQIGSHPEKVNEYGFDTGTSWPADSYFVVPLAP